MSANKLGDAKEKLFWEYLENGGKITPDKAVPATPKRQRKKKERRGMEENKSAEGGSSGSREGSVRH